MQIRNVGNQGNVDRTGDLSERSKRAERRESSSVSPAAANDATTISSAGREIAARVDELSDRARGEDGDRDAIVEAARQKLESGGLDSAESFAETANQLIDRGFLSA
ncbi:MAG: hypothetical protein AB8H80_00135 [Planctomycetota bacterium]